MFSSARWCHLMSQDGVKSHKRSYRLLVPNAWCCITESWDAFLELLQLGSWIWRFCFIPTYVNQEDHSSADVGFLPSRLSESKSGKITEPQGSELVISKFPMKCSWTRKDHESFFRKFHQVFLLRFFSYGIDGIFIFFLDLKFMELMRFWIFLIWNWRNFQWNWLNLYLRWNRWKRWNFQFVNWIWNLWNFQFFLWIWNSWNWRDFEFFCEFFFFCLVLFKEISWSLLCFTSEFWP